VHTNLLKPDPSQPSSSRARGSITKPVVTHGLR